MRKRSRVALCLGLSLLMLVACITGCQQKATPEATATPKPLDVVRLMEVTHSVFYAPQYAAIELGFFEEEGISVELTNGGGADKCMTAILSGEADIGFMGPESAIYVYNEGREDHAVVFAQVTKRDGSFLVGREKVEDFNWEMLRDSEVIGGRKGGVPEMTLEYVMRQNGLEPGTDLEVRTDIQFNLMGGAFTGGTGDYVTLFEPAASAVEAEGAGYILAAIGAESGEIPYTTYIATQSFLKDNADLAQRFTNAVYKGQKWVASHTPEEVAEVIKGSFPDTDLELLTTVVKRYQDIDAWMTEPVMKEEAFEKLQDVMEDAGELDKRAAFDAFVDNTFAKKAVETIK